MPVSGTRCAAMRPVKVSHAASGLACVLMLAACAPAPVVHTGEPRTVAPYSEVPVSANFPTTAQLKLQAAQHWAKIADDTGKAIAGLLGKGAACSPSLKTCRAVFINPPAYTTEFSRTFHSQLITTLVTGGMHVSKVSDGAVIIDIDVQPVTFATNRPQYRFAGKATELGPGIWALRDVSKNAPADNRVTPPEGDTLHWFRTEFAAGQTPQMEIVVTVSASDNTRYLARATNVYYVTEGDKRLYDQEICSLIAPCGNKSVIFGDLPESKAKPGRPIELTGDCPIDRSCPEDAAKKPVKKGKKKS